MHFKNNPASQHLYLRTTYYIWEIPMDMIIRSPFLADVINFVRVSDIESLSFWIFLQCGTKCDSLPSCFTKPTTYKLGVR